MKKFFLTLPGGQVIASNTKYTNLGTFISDLYQVVFYVATFVAFFWLVWGVFEYLVAGGDKNGIASARKRITWAVVGLIFVLMAYLLAQWSAQVILPADKINRIPIL